ncbi:MAG: Rieske 2Fe-2S domain-containing protein [Acidimicrobiales bacterium]
MTWVSLLPSAEVGPGEIRAVVPAGREVVVWRAADGRLSVCDARCPHQWSHLEAEGVVDGDELVCTAHFWRFDVDGHGTKLSVKGRRDEKADLMTYPCRECDGVIEADLPTD